MAWNRFARRASDDNVKGVRCLSCSAVAAAADIQSPEVGNRSERPSSTDTRTLSTSLGSRPAGPRRARLASTGYVCRPGGPSTCLRADGRSRQSGTESARRPAGGLGGDRQQRRCHHQGPSPRTGEARPT